MKKVSYVIEVPDSAYCWDGNTACQFFDNSQGYDDCNLNFIFCNFKRDEQGRRLKSAECEKLPSEKQVDEMLVIIARDSDGTLSAWNPETPPIAWEYGHHLFHWCAEKAGPKSEDECIADNGPGTNRKTVTEMFGKGCFGVRKGRKQLLCLKKLS